MVKRALEVLVTVMTMVMGVVMMLVAVMVFVMLMLMVMTTTMVKMPVVTEWHFCYCSREKAPGKMTSWTLLPSSFCKNSLCPRVFTLLFRLTEENQCRPPKKSS